MILQEIGADPADHHLFAEIDDCFQVFPFKAQPVKVVIVDAPQPVGQGTGSSRLVFRAVGGHQFHRLANGQVAVGIFQQEPVHLLPVSLR